MTKVKTNRQSIIDLWRIIACIGVLTHHSYLLRNPNSTYPLYQSFIYVDLFFILTGYFTAKHFVGKDYSDRGKENFNYFFKKFAAFLPYTTIAILIQYVLESIEYTDGGIKSFIGSFYDMPLEMLFLTESYRQVAHVVPMWFLSAMFIAFPVYLLLLRIKDRYALLFVAFVYCAVFYNRFEIVGSRTWPKDPFRALAGLLFGSFLFILNQIIREKGIITEEKKTEVLLAIIEISCFVIIFIITFFNCKDLEKNMLVLTGLAVLISTSGYSFTARLNSSVITYIGKLTMPVYIWQWPVGSVIAKILEVCFGDISGVPLGLRLFLYYFVTIAVSILSFEIVERVKKKKQKN